MIRLLGALSCIMTLVSCSEEPRDVETHFGDDMVSEQSFDAHLALVGRTHSSSEVKNVILNERVDEALLAREAARLGLDEEREVKERLDLYRRKVLSQRYVDYLLRQEVNEKQLTTEYLANTDEYSENVIVLRQLVVPMTAAGELEDVVSAIDGGTDLREAAELVPGKYYFTEREAGVDSVARTFGSEVANGGAKTVSGPFELENDSVFVQIVVPQHRKTKPFEEVKRLLLEKHRREVRRKAIERIRNGVQVSVK